jgi:hypothetical protein
MKKLLILLKRKVNKIYHHLFPKYFTELESFISFAIKGGYSIYIKEKLISDTSCSIFADQLYPLSPFYSGFSALILRGKATDQFDIIYECFLGRYDTNSTKNILTNREHIINLLSSLNLIATDDSNETF